MRLPEKNSRQEQILKTFIEKGPMTIWQAVEVHGNFKTQKLPGGESHERLAEMYSDLVDRGCLVREGILYRIHVRASDQLCRKLRTDAQDERSIVPPRVRNFFEKTLRIGHSAGAPWRIAL